MLPPEVRASFPGDPASASAARRFVDRTLRDWSCDHLTDVASLLLSELVANAVLHAGTSIDVAIRVHAERLRIEVHDGSARLPSRKHYSSWSATGRGLMLVERMADDWGVDMTPSGKIVWFELDTGGASNSPDFGLVGLEELDFDLDDLAPARRRGGDGNGPGTSAEGPRLLIGSGPRR